MIDLDKSCKSSNGIMEIIIKGRKKQRAKNILSLTNVILTIIFTIISLLFLLLSFIFNCKNCIWLSDTCLSLATGGITGIVFYALSNVRTNKLQYAIESKNILNALNENLFGIVITPTVYIATSVYSSLYEYAYNTYDKLKKVEAVSYTHLDVYKRQARAPPSAPTDAPWKSWR